VVGGNGGIPDGARREVPAPASGGGGAGEWAGPVAGPPGTARAAASPQRPRAAVGPGGGRATQDGGPKGGLEFDDPGVNHAINPTRGENQTAQNLNAKNPSELYLRIFKQMHPPGRLAEVLKPMALVVHS